MQIFTILDLVITLEGTIKPDVAWFIVELADSTVGTEIPAVSHAARKTTIEGLDFDITSVWTSSIFIVLQDINTKLMNKCFNKLDCLCGPSASCDTIFLSLFVVASTISEFICWDNIFLFQDVVKILLSRIYGHTSDCTADGISAFVWNLSIASLSLTSNMILTVESLFSLRTLSHLKAMGVEQQSIKLK